MRDNELRKELKELGIFDKNYNCLIAEPGIKDIASRLNSLAEALGYSPDWPVLTGYWRKNKPTASEASKKGKQCAT